MQPFLRASYIVLQAHPIPVSRREEALSVFLGRLHRRVNRNYAWEMNFELFG